MNNKYSIGTAAFWENPLRTTDAHADEDYTSPYAVAKDYGLGEIQSAQGTEFSSESSSSFFYIASKGINGEAREIIMHNNRSVGDGSATDEEIALNIHVSEKDSPTSSIQSKTYNISNISWAATGGTSYDTSYDIQNSLPTPTWSPQSVT